MIFTNWLIHRAQRTPYTHLMGYMNRWWLVPMVRKYAEDDGSGPVSWWRRPFSRLLQCFGVAIRVHEILRSDLDRYPHDHPWPYLTIILKGAYYEEQYDAAGERTGLLYCPAGSILWRPIGSWHRLILTEGPVWTLFITFRYVGTWGFNVNGAKVPWREYENTNIDDLHQ